LAPRAANWPPKFQAILFFFFSPPWGQYKALKSSAFISTLGQIEKFLLSISALNPSVKPLGLISTFAPIGMLDLG
jgi:hypothetical protein